MHIAYTFVQIPCQTIDLTLFMSNIFFKFKKFTIVQDQCAMKVGTDGVLLGAWANIEECKHVLDIGTGTGLIALMIAQRNSKAIVDAIDIDEQCVVQAKQNIESSPFAERVDVESISFQNFSQQDDKRYDLIVSNSPYFQNALKSPNQSRNHARHNNSLSFLDIISQGIDLLSENGRIALILPYEFKNTVIDHAAKFNLFANRITNVFPLPHKPAKRLLIEFGQSELECVEDNLIIELARHQYTSEFKELTHDFYLDR